MSANHPASPPTSEDAANLQGASGVSAPVVEVCAGCHLPLTRRGTQGECLRCALGLALSGIDSTEEPGDPTNGTPAFGKDPLPDEGPMRYGHFEVALGFDGQARELGRGAMATTYRALDTVLHSPVALKVISQNVADQPAARARFLREARAAAKLHHPNVAAVTFYGEERGECFYAMELVEGETLAERVQRAGTFTPEQAMEVGIQVARALAAAEAVGVVHRDLKPSNLMLVGAAGGEEAPLHVKVIDWGLAKAVSAEDTLLGADHTRGGFVGTPAFASPEQFARGESQRIDVRSDIYSLGVTLWFLLCGKVPFVGDTLDAIHARQRALPLEQLRAAKVPRALGELLKSMVAYDPARRPQSARELLDRLRLCQAQHPSESTPSAKRQEHRRRTVAALGLFAILLFSVGLRLWPQRQRAASRNNGKPSLAVLPFENLTSDQADAFFTVGMQDEINEDLARIAQLNVLSPGSTRSYPAGQPRDYAAIGRALGVRHLLEGSVRRGNGQVHIAIRLVNSDDPTKTWRSEDDGGLGDVFGLQSRISLAVARQLQAPVAETERLSIEHSPTSDPQAHDLYLHAEALLQGTTPDNELPHNLERIALLEAAVARDPSFVRAYCRLSNGHLWFYQNRFTLPPAEQMVDHRGLADAALAQARRLAPDDGYVHYATAVNLYIAGNNVDQARIELDLARRVLPNDADVDSMFGEVAFDQGHWQEAKRFLERADALGPLDWKQHFISAQYFRRLRDEAGYVRIMTQTLSAMPMKDSGYYRATSDIGLFDMRADPVLYKTVLEELSPTDDPVGRLRFFYGFVLNLFSRNADGAADVLDRYKADPIRHGTHLYPRVWFEAQLARLKGDDAGAKAAFAATRRWLEKETNAHPDDGWALSMIAVCDAGIGRKEDAVSEAKRAVELTPYGHELDCASCVRSNQALVYAWTAQPDLALDVLEALADKPGSFDIPTQPSFGDLKFNPCWDALRGSPRFETLVPRFAQPVPGS